MGKKKKKGRRPPKAEQSSSESNVVDGSPPEVVEAEPSESEPAEEPVVDGSISPAEEGGARSPEPRRAPRDSGAPSWLAALLPEQAPSFLRHIHPRSVFARSLEPVRTLGLGLVSLYLALILAITGVLLMVYYVPSAEGAYGSIQDLHAVVPFGGLVRNIHRWAGHAMVLVVALHMLRTILTGSYKAGRHGVWTAGVWLLVLTLAFAFTGYLLPWDQLSYWAVSIGGHLARNVPFAGGALAAALLGGEEVSGATLVRFYALHVGILPLLTTVYVALHLYRLRRAGGLARPERAASAKVPAWPHLYEREIALLVLCIVLVFLAGILFEAPLGAEPDVQHPDNPSKAPWYFLGLQELVSYSSLVGGVVVPFLSVVVLYLIPSLDRDREGAGTWLAPASGRLAFIVGALVSAVVVPGSLALHELQDDRFSDAMNPATLILAAVVLVALSIGWAKRSPRLAVLAAAGSGTVAVAILTVVGLWIRGPSWALVFPWGSP